MYTLQKVSYKRPPVKMNMVLAIKTTFLNYDWLGTYKKTH